MLRTDGVVAQRYFDAGARGHQRPFQQLPLWHYYQHQSPTTSYPKGSRKKNPPQNSQPMLQKPVNPNRAGGVSCNRLVCKCDEAKVPRDSNVHARSEVAASLRSNARCEKGKNAVRKETHTKRSKKEVVGRCKTARRRHRPRLRNRNRMTIPTRRARHRSHPLLHPRHGQQRKVSSTNRSRAEGIPPTTRHLAEPIARPPGVKPAVVLLR
ncbi:hypothetical protein GE09DRAFT_1122517 [Coniochaeta sp. 2T2.1]|nr:hypothetical protein GE09DRAFT_1122517 [Coniochaeta sp. 2T2.1]